MGIYFCNIKNVFLCDISDDDGNNQWPDILKFLYECCNSSENGMKEVALHIIM